MPYLIVIHVGPVQGFIATARRSRDLWYGSRILSELARTVAQAVSENAGNAPDAGLIFPAPEVARDPDLMPSVANRIVAVIDEPETAAAKAEQALREKLETLFSAALGNVTGPLETDERAKRQVMDLPEFYWVATPLDNDYDQARRRADALMAARKNSRNFGPSPESDSRPKSSLDGQLESVIPEDAYPAPGLRENNSTEWEKLIRGLYEKYGARGAERLSGVDLLKRHGASGAESRFPSTSHMAAKPLFQRLSKQTGAREAWQSYVNQLPFWFRYSEQVPERFHVEGFQDIKAGRDEAGQPSGDPLDGSLLFQSRLREGLAGDNLAKAERALTEFKKATQTGASEPQPYYAILLGDGDNMGAVIDSRAKLEEHRDFSMTLATFADGVQEVVEAYGGALIYAGGDDVLALLPLHSALACAEHLATSFRKQMAGFTYVRDGRERKPTFSAGIAVVHHLEPLSDALQLARDTEKLAKHTPDKDALAIAVDKRGGPTREIAGQWEELYSRLQWEIYWQRADVDAFPGGAPYELREVVMEMGGPAAVAGSPSRQAVVKMEALRILTRKRAEHGARQLADEVRDQLLGWLETESERPLAGEAAGQLPQGPKRRAVDVDHLADELVIARLFARAMDEAGEAVTPPTAREKGANDVLDN